MVQGELAHSFAERDLGFGLRCAFHRSDAMRTFVRAHASSSCGKTVTLHPHSLGMTTSDFPVRPPSSCSALAGPPRHSSVVAFRSRNPIDVAEQFAAELSDDSIRTIDCDQCVLQHSNACHNCVVTFLLALDNAVKPVVAMTAPEVDTLQLLQATGLAPQSQFAVRPVALASRRLVRN